MQALTDLILKVFNGNLILSVICFSLIPVIEIRGAIPLGISLGLNPLKSVYLSLIGSMISCVLFLLFLPFIFKLFEKTKFYNKFLNAIMPKVKLLEEKKFNIYIALMLFVAIPLPLTGVTTACIVSCILKLKKEKSFFFIMLGNIIASIIISLTTLLLGSYSIILTLIFVIAFFIIALTYILKVVR